MDRRYAMGVLWWVGNERVGCHTKVVCIFNVHVRTFGGGRDGVGAGAVSRC